MKHCVVSVTALALCLAPAGATDFTMLNAGASAQALIPSAANGGNAAGYQWWLELPPANIGSWLSGNTGVGYDANTATGGNYLPHIGLNVGAMQNVNGSVFVRIPFTVDPAQRPLFKSLALRMRYDDGFVAWINGTKVASAGEPATLAWNSFALNGQSHDANLTGWEDFDITQHLSLLHDGANLLAIQGLNANNPSTDLLVGLQLVATDITPPPQPRWPAPVFVEVPGVGARTRPVAIAHAGDGSGRLFIVEQAGVIQMLSGTTVAPFLDINARVLGNNDTTSNPAGGNEEGLLGLAFPPGFAQSGRFYVAYTRLDRGLQLSRFSLMAGNPNAGDPNSEQILLTIPHPIESNHNGSDIHFGSDGYLYYSTGDGGGGGDTPNNAQNPLKLLGKMLRLDVEGQAAGGSLIPPSNPWASPTDGVSDEIYHMGLRNPWRWSFDRETGDMWIGDVGQGLYEEVDFIPGNTPGLNFGWHRREGLHNYDLSNPYWPGTVVVEPITEKTHSEGDVSVTGGYVYRGLKFPRMTGTYFYGDYGSDRLYGLRKDDAGAWRVTTLRTDCTAVSAFGEDEAGELYWANNSSGRVYRIDDGGSDSQYLKIVSHSVDPANGRVTFTWGAATSKDYVPEVSTDGVAWTGAGPPQTAAASNNFRLTYTEPADPAAGTTRRFFRAREL